MKRCSKCKVLLPVTEFYKDNSRKDNLQDWCKTCKRDWAYFRYDKNVNHQKYLLYKQRKKLKKIPDYQI